MKKLWIAFIMALLALAFVAAPALAYCPPDQDGASAEATCDEPGVSDESPYVGNTILFYGTVHIDASSFNNKDYPGGYSHYLHSWYIAGAYASVNGSAYYVIYAPDGTTIVASGGDSWADSEVGDSGTILFIIPWDENVSASISEDWYWEESVLLNRQGDYTVEQGGEATAEYGHWVEYGHYELYWHGWLPKLVWVPDGPPTFYVEGDPAYDSCFSSRTVTALANSPLSTSRNRPILTIQLPTGGEIYLGDHSEQFFTSDGWGDPTTEFIVYTDGIWQVEVAAGSRILLDGEWHDKTWIEVDDQGNVIGRYGSNGSIIAEDIALSQPIKITKVG